MSKKKLQELQEQYEKMPKTYILECHSKYGVDYKLVIDLILIRKHIKKLV